MGVVTTDLLTERLSTREFFLKVTLPRQTTQRVYCILHSSSFLSIPFLRHYSIPDSKHDFHQTIVPYTIFDVYIFVRPVLDISSLPSRIAKTYGQRNSGRIIEKEREARASRKVEPNLKEEAPFSPERKKRGTNSKKRAKKLGNREGKGSVCGYFSRVFFPASGACGLFPPIFPPKADSNHLARKVIESFPSSSSSSEGKETPKSEEPLEELLGSHTCPTF